MSLSFVVYFMSSSCIDSYGPQSTNINKKKQTPWVVVVGRVGVGMGVVIPVCGISTIKNLQIFAFTHKGSCIICDYVLY
jgi:hypothetical protein